MSLGCSYHCDEYPFSSTEDTYGVYKEITGPAIFDTYGEDVMIVEPIDYVFKKDAFKTMHAYLRDFRGSIKSETLRSNSDENNRTKIIGDLNEFKKTLILSILRLNKIFAIILVFRVF
ncbi:hypothetical protein YC2023_051543 [Brassica napus]